MGLWAADRPMDVGAKMASQARQLKVANPEGKVWVYRNLAKAESCFAEVREKLSDHGWDGFFLKFANGSKYYDPRCYNHAAGWKMPIAEANCDCGSVPCGTYLFDHRNATLREWLGTVHVAGPTGVGSPHVDGLYIDDGWSADNTSPPAPPHTISPPWPRNGWWSGHGSC